MHYMSLLLVEGNCSFLLAGGPKMPDEMERAVDEDIDILDPDFSEAEVWDPVPAGNYSVEVINIAGPLWPKGIDPDNPFRADGQRANRYVRFDLRTFNMPAFPNQRIRSLNAPYEGPMAGILERTLKALKPDYQRGDKLPKVELVGAKAIAVVEDAEWPKGSGEKSNNTRRLLPFK